MYYGKGRKALLEDLGQNILVITTYSLVRMDWKVSLQETDAGQPCGLHSLTWERVVLDEGASPQGISKVMAASYTIPYPQQKLISLVFGLTWI